MRPSPASFVAEEGLQTNNLEKPNPIVGAMVPGSHEVSKAPQFPPTSMTSNDELVVEKLCISSSILESPDTLAEVPGSFRTCRVGLVVAVTTSFK